MNVLSLFDGMSCGQIALRELGVKVDNYFASEIDKFAIAQTRLNFPDTVQLGDVRNVRAKDLPEIDLLIGGSPCQGFSFAGRRLNFDDPRSRLFFEFVRVLRECREVNPGVKFLLENVRMKREYEQAISDTLGIRPVMINSALVSAQNRVRLYWSDIRTAPDGLFHRKTDIPLPRDRGLLLRDVLEEEVVAVVQRPRGYNKGGTFTDKSPTLSASSWEHNNLVVRRKVRQTNPGTRSGGKQPYQQDRVYETGGIAPALCSAHAGAAPLVKEGETVRHITPAEAARLQTIPGWYKWGCSATQQYKMLGNGWTVEVIKHIFSFLDFSKTD